jgi:multidrug efflux pump subunit AcrA (membrane-fusion protein)
VPNATRLVRIILPRAAAFVGCSDRDEGAKDDAKNTSAPVEVKTLAAKTQSVQRSVDVIGTLYGQEDVTISNKVAGKVVTIYKDIGDRAKPGEVLAQLLKNDYQLSLNEKQSALQEALSSLGLSDVPPDDFDLEKVPAVRRAKLQAQNAKAKLDRARQLNEAKPPLISPQDYADLQTEAAVAESAHETARLEARSQVSTARTRKAQVAIAEQALRDTTIRAPMPDDTRNNTANPATQPVADASGQASLPPQITYAVAARYTSEGELNAALTKMFRLVIDDPL